MRRKVISERDHLLSENPDLWFGSRCHELTIQLEALNCASRTELRALRIAYDQKLNETMDTIVLFERRNRINHSGQSILKNIIVIMGATYYQDVSRIIYFIRSTMKHDKENIPNVIQLAGEYADGLLVSIISALAKEKLEKRLYYSYAKLILEQMAKYLPESLFHPAVTSFYRFSPGFITITDGSERFVPQGMLRHAVSLRPDLLLDILAGVLFWLEDRNSSTKEVFRMLYAIKKDNPTLIINFLNDLCKVSIVPHGHIVNSLLQHGGLNNKMLKVILTILLPSNIAQIKKALTLMQQARQKELG